MESVVFSDSPGHIIDVPPTVVEKAATFVRQLMESTRNKGRLWSVGNISRQPLTIKSYISAYLKDSTSTVWTKEHPRFYACRSCVNTQRLCRIAVGSLIFVLPLHPALRDLTLMQGDEGSDK